MPEGQKFSQRQKETIRKDQEYICPGCGRIFPAHRGSDPRRQMLEVHHKHPRSQGGGNDKGNGVGLCGPHGCHEVFNRLALKYGISYEEVVSRFGYLPLRRHMRLLEDVPGRVEKRLVKQIHRRAN